MPSTGRLKTYTLLLPLLALLSLSGCGYSLMGRKAINVPDIRIGTIKNITYEPGLDDALIRALKDQLMQEGFVINPASKDVIHGTITSYQITGVSIVNDIFSAYQISIAGKFYYRDASGKELLLRGDTPFIVTFQATDPLNTVFADRQAAEESALHDLSSNIVSSLVYR
ncbi:MAG: LPS assembly lipoprotein LptE [Nitrospiraceae bacterium]|nr:LPS assembly lipoprotein LptE [Nitrospiraceae bacterium]